MPSRSWRRRYLESERPRDKPHLLRPSSLLTSTCLKFICTGQLCPRSCWLDCTSETGALSLWTFRHCCVNIRGCWVIYEILASIRRHLCICLRLGKKICWEHWRKKVFQDKERKGITQILHSCMSSENRFYSTTAYWLGTDMSTR